MEISHENVYLHIPVAQLPRFGIDGENVSCCVDVLLAALPTASVAESELCFEADSDP